MEKRNVKKYVVIGLFVILAVVWAGIKLFEIQFGKEERAGGDQDVIDYYNDIYYPDEKDDTTFADDKSAELLKIYYKVEDISISKEVDPVAAENNFYPDVNVSDGNIVNDYSFAVITVKVSNNRKKETELTLNTNRVNAVKDNECIESYEAFYMTPSQYGTESSELFHVDLEPGEEKEVQVYYIVNDKYLSDNYKLNYLINPSGVDPDSIPGKNADSSKYIANIDIKNFTNE